VLFAPASCYFRDSTVGIATRYRLDGPGIESRWARFFAPVQNGPEAHPASYTMGIRSYPGVKRPERGVDHPPPSSAEVEGEVELYDYIYSPYGPSWFFSKFAFTFTSSYSTQHPGPRQWRTEGWFGGFNPPPPKFLSFDKAEPNSQFRGKYIRNSLIRIWIPLICKLSATPD
jgi:hypothetical protein